MHLFTLTLPLALVGCAKRPTVAQPAAAEQPPVTPDVEGPPRAAPTPPIKTSIEALGGHVFLYMKGGSLVAKDAESLAEKVVLTGQFRSGILEPALDLVWLLSEKEVYVVDLRENAPMARKIATKTSWMDREHLDALLVLWKTVDGKGVTWGSWVRCRVAEEIRLSLGDPPDPIPGYKSDDENVRVFDEEWLKAQRERTVNKQAMDRPKWWRSPELFEAPKGCQRGTSCDDACGIGVPFGASGQALVVVKVWEGKPKIGDICPCHYSCSLRRPGGQWAKMGESSQCGPYTFDLSGRWYFEQEGNQVCNVDNRCVGLDDGKAIGFLSGQVSLQGPDDWTASTE